MLSAMRRVGYFEAGDAIRGWGVLGVIVVHCATASLFSLAKEDPVALQTLVATGDVGWEKLFDDRRLGAGVLSLQLVVYLFFGLSAYLLSRPYVAAALGQTRRAPPLGRYVKHRVGRVVPVFWFMVVVCIVWFGTDGTSWGEMVATFALGQYWTSAPFNSHLSQAWTLNVEAVFYVALPLVAAAGMWLFARGGRARGPLSLLPMAVVCIAAWLLGTAWLPETTVPSQSPIGGLVTFAPGVLIAVVEARWGDRIGAFRWVPMVAVAMVLAGLALNYKLLSLADGGSAAERDLLTIAAGLVLGGIVLWQTTGRPTWRVLRFRAVHWIGERSFSIYVSHGLVLLEMRQIGEGQPTVGRHFLLLALAVVPVCLLVGDVLYRCIERPFTRLSRGERPLFRTGPLQRKGSGAPTVGTTPVESAPALVNAETT